MSHTFTLYQCRYCGESDLSALQAGWDRLLSCTDRRTCARRALARVHRCGASCHPRPVHLVYRDAAAGRRVASLAARESDRRATVGGYAR